MSGPRRHRWAGVVAVVALAACTAPGAEAPRVALDEAAQRVAAPTEQAVPDQLRDPTEPGQPTARAEPTPGTTAWEPIPPGPLPPRAEVSAVWTGREVVLLGGEITTGAPGPDDCPDEETGTTTWCEPEDVPIRTVRDGAAYDPVAGTWRTIPAPPPRLALRSMPRPTGDGLIGAGARYDETATAWAPLPDQHALVRDSPHWTGRELVALGWDYALGERDGVGQVVVSELDPDADSTWRATPWPFDPPGLEGVSSVWTGEEVVAFVWRECDHGEPCTAMLGWNPTTDTWRDIATLPGDPPRSPAWDGEAIVAGATTHGLRRIDATSGAETVIPQPPAPLHGMDPVVGDGVVAVYEDDRGAVYDVEAGAWMSLPPAPFTTMAAGRAVVWAGEDLLVWGGAPPAGSQDDATPQGYLLRASALRAPVRETASGLEARPAGWSRLAAGPLDARHGAAAFAVGGEVLVIGGRDDPVCPPTASCIDPEPSGLADGAAYDPTTGRWRRIAPAPLPVTSARGVAVVETLYLLVADQEWSTRFLAYHLPENRWEQLPPPDGENLQLVAVRDGIVAVRTTHEGGAPADLLYDPETRAWTELPPDPTGPSFDRAAVVIEGELIALGLPLVPQPGREPSLYQAAAYRPWDGTWRRLPRPADTTAIGFWGNNWFPVDGRAVNPHVGSSDGGLTNRFDRAYPHGGALDPRSGAWSHLVNAPAKPTGEGPQRNWVAGSAEAVIADGWLHRPATAGWTAIDANPDLPDEGHAVVLLGDRLLVWGGGWWDGDLSADGWIWTPPN